jgi:hypothetical protein
VTLTAAPWALDGARSPASLARLATRAAVKQSGIINPGDMKVLPLSTPGDGVRISVGGAVLENRYTATSGQSYVVEATAEEILGASQNFSGIIGQGTTKHHLICVSIGDPNYSVAGHPWMTTAMQDDLEASPETALDFQYVRAWVIKDVPLGTARVEDLISPPGYPVYALARLEVPNGSGSITSGMIKDLRQVVNPRSQNVQWNVAIASDDLLTVPVDLQYETWPDNSVKDIYIPPWATRVYVTAWIHNFFKGANILTDARMRVAAFNGATRKFNGAAVKFYNPAPGQANTRWTTLIGDPMDIPSADRGTTRTFLTEATLVDHTAMNNNIKCDIGTSVMVSLRFVEEAV